jgi:hypothetical protein
MDADSAASGRRRGTSNEFKPSCLPRPDWSHILEMQESKEIVHVYRNRYT